MSFYIFLILFENSILSSFRSKKLHHLSRWTVLVFITFLFLIFVFEPEISSSSHREVFLITTVPVGQGRENTYEDAILLGILFTKSL